VIDTHCHLTFPDFAGQVPQTLEEARKAGVTGAITVSTTMRDCVDALAIAEEHENVWCTAGVHPLYSHQGPHDWEMLLRVARSPRCVAWGELGLDNHYENPPRDMQDRVLSEQLGIIESAVTAGAGKLPPIDLPIVLHCREAFDDLILRLRRTRLAPSRFVFHCFTGSEDDARKVLDFGAMISFTGVVTYRNARDVQEAARLVPLNRIMVETDAPFLSPEPHRGRRPCKPWMTSLTARRLAELRGEDWEHFHAAINENTRRFFGIPA
jgi:TatD DNase family protein